MALVFNHSINMQDILVRIKTKLKANCLMLGLVIIYMANYVVLL